MGSEFRKGRLVFAVASLMGIFWLPTFEVAFCFVWEKTLSVCGGFYLPGLAVCLCILSPCFLLSLAVTRSGGGALDGICADGFWVIFFSFFSEFGSWVLGAYGHLAEGWAREGLFTLRLFCV